MFNTNELIQTRKTAFLIANMNQREDMTMRENLPLENYNRLEELAAQVRPNIARTAPEMGRFNQVLTSLATKEDFIALIRDMLSASVADIACKADQEINESRERFQDREHNPRLATHQFEEDARRAIQINRYYRREISMDEVHADYDGRKVPREEVAKELEDMYKHYRADALQKRVQHVATLLAPYVEAANQSLGKDMVQLADLEKEVFEGPQPSMRALG